MRRVSLKRALTTTVLFAALIPITAACSDSNPSASPTVGNSADPTASPGSGETPGPGATGSTSDKAACTAITTHLSTWGTAFAQAASGLAAAGNDQGKVETVVNNVKAANTKFANDLRAEGNKSTDPQVKKVANDLAAAMEKVNSTLNTQAVMQNPDSLVSIFDQPEYAASAEAFEKLCGAA